MDLTAVIHEKDNMSSHINMVDYPVSRKSDFGNSVFFSVISFIVNRHRQKIKSEIKGRGVTKKGGSTGKLGCICSNNLKNEHSHLS